MAVRSVGSIAAVQHNLGLALGHFLPEMGARPLLLTRLQSLPNPRHELDAIREGALTGMDTDT